MYKWYEWAAICYVYLSDVHHSSDSIKGFMHEFQASRWWRRGWTLQELLAQLHVKLFSSNWVYLGVKKDLSLQISKTSRIDRDFLNGWRYVA